MLLAAPDDQTAAYGDLVERTLYNVVATSPSEDGRAFYYANTLHQREPGTETDPNVASSRAQSSLRAAWFDVSCCPTNVARTFASLAAYVASVDSDGIQIHQYVPAKIRTTLDNGTALAIDIETAYPADGAIVVRFVEAAQTTVSVRIPQWAAGATVDGRPAEPGVVSIERSFAAGDTIVLVLPIAPRFTYPNSQIDAVRGSVAVERGPEVLCLESVDLSAAGLGTDIGRVRVDTSVPPADENGQVRVRLTVDPTITDNDWPYTSAPIAGQGTTKDVGLLPYHGWAERGPSTMRVWMPVKEYSND
jgi:DUF1680 family protein